VIRLQTILRFVVPVLPLLAIAALWVISRQFNSLRQERQWLLLPNGEHRILARADPESRLALPAQPGARLHARRLIFATYPTSVAWYLYEYEYDAAKFEGIAEYHYDFEDGAPIDSQWHDQKYPPRYYQPIPTRLGLGYVHRTITDATKSRKFTAAVIRYEVLLLLASIPPVWKGAKWVRRQLRRCIACSQCGYDLRATPDRCPECGKATRPLQSAKI
jgi:hypothetical protein